MPPALLRFPVPDEPVSINKAPSSRGGAIGWSRRRAKWRDTCTAYAVEHRVIRRGLGPSNIQVTIPFKDQRRRDPHNYMIVVKWIIDGLVNAGAWPNDGPDYVTVLDPLLVVSDEVIVRIEPRNVKTHV